MGVRGKGAAPLRNWIFIKVDTDEGITGVGEATTEYHESAVVAMAENHFGPLLIGEDPTKVHRAWQKMQRLFWWRGGVVASSAASGIEQALWDITGKAYDQPVHKLLGGAVRDRIRLYARGDLGLSSWKAESEAAVKEGFSAFKFGQRKLVNPFDEEEQVEVALSNAREIQGAVGPDCDLIVDCAGLFSRTAAHRLIEGLKATRIFFIEEPVNADTPQGLVELRSAFPNVPIAGGERVMTRWGFRDWLERGAVDIIQPDVAHCGGIGELLRIASYAEVYGVPLAPHNPYGPVATAASVHCCALIQNFLILEHCRVRPCFDRVQKFGPEIKNGCALLPDRPGLGIELDWDYVRQHPYEPIGPNVPIDRYGGFPSI